MGKKIFCKWCKYVRDALNTQISYTNCAYPDNIIGNEEINQDDFYEPHEMHRTLYRRTANKINKNNDCGWYK